MIPLEYEELEKAIRQYLYRMRDIQKVIPLSQNQKYRVKIYELALEHIDAKKKNSSQNNLPR